MTQTISYKYRLFVCWGRGFLVVACLLLPLISPSFSQAKTTVPVIKKQVQAVVKDRQAYNQTASASAQKMEQQELLQDQHVQQAGSMQEAVAAAEPTPSYPPDKVYFNWFNGLIRLYRSQGQIYLRLFYRETV